MEFPSWHRIYEKYIFLLSLQLPFLKIFVVFSFTFLGFALNLITWVFTLMQVCCCILFFFFSSCFYLYLPFILFLFSMMQAVAMLTYQPYVIFKEVKAGTFFDYGTHLDQCYKSFSASKVQSNDFFGLKAPY